ncbi:hypothetical protein B0H17DRAFT_1196141 [Mycena rosella]|uniref:Uncharacterized protein n=1 Tax=Mycena rosella TaxID=1033263 RepID=A0AAD7CV84_MYCRO|nr:hypothetical protein B0H17DRAFT_1211012 [Mycena rosella]KAJ7700156.1 hypothetical protein B0H17DRAFT_1196141 [Mycena rosella]
MNIAYTRALERESAGLLKQMENESERNEHAWYHRRARRKPETPSFGLRVPLNVSHPLAFLSSAATLPTVG